MTRVAVLGLGSIGLRHARNLMALDCDVVGFDPDPERQRMLAAENGDIAETRAEALQAADAAVIASPNSMHLDDLAAAVDAGCHTLVEKPLAHTDAGVAPVLQKARDAGLIVFSGFNLRFHPCVTAAKALIKSAMLGTVVWGRFHYASYLPDWRPGTDHTRGYANDPQTGGVIFDVIHELDLATYLLGPATVQAATAQNTGLLNLDAEDCADLVFQHESGVQSAIHLDYFGKPPSREFEITGLQARMHADLNARRLWVTDRVGACLQDTTFDGAYVDDYAAQTAAFLASIAGNETPPCDGWQAFDVLRIAIAARRQCGLPQQ